MNLKNIKERQPEPQHNSDSAADSSHVSPTCPKPIVSGSLSDYIQGLFEKKSKVFIHPVKMNKRKANYALRLLDKMAKELDLLMDCPDDDIYSEYMDCIVWFRNQILKRYSKSETIL